MKLGPIPENLIERVLLKLGLLPAPLLDTQIAFSLAMTVMLGSKLGVFEVLAAGPLTAEEISSWQQQAGLKPQKPIWLRSLPGTAQQAAIKKG